MHAGYGNQEASSRHGSAGQGGPFVLAVLLPESLTQIMQPTGKMQIEGLIW